MMGCCQSFFCGDEGVAAEEEKNGNVQGQVQQQLHQTTPTQHNHHHHHHHPPPTVGPEPPSLAGSGTGPGPGRAPAAFSEFSLAELKAATNNFSADFVVSESGEKAANVVYKGRLQNRSWIAVKKFTKLAWPDPKQFAVPIPSLSLSFLCLFCVISVKLRMLFLFV